MLLNNIPVLDDGYVALLSSALSHMTYKDVVDEYFGAVDNINLRKACFATLVFRAPIFVQLHLSQHGLTLISTKNSDVSAYKPNGGEVGCQDHATSKDIADDIARTTDALLINPAAYKADGADPFISQVIMPISTYTTFIVAGTLEQWQKFYQYKSVPTPIRAYADAVENIMKAEWKNV